MPRYMSQLNHNGLPFGAIVDIPDEEVENWEGEIEAGFLTPEYAPPAIFSAADVTADDVAALGVTLDVPAEPEPTE